jgi:hypothetical protein
MSIKVRLTMGERLGDMAALPKQVFSPIHLLDVTKTLLLPPTKLNARSTGMPNIFYARVDRRRLR